MWAELAAVALTLARDLDELRAWWTEQQGVLRTLPPDALATVTKAKDRHKAALLRQG